MADLKQWAEELDELISHPDIDDPEWILEEVAKRMADMPKQTFKWVIEIEVDEGWVADGFTFCADTIQHLEENLIPAAIPGTEVKVRVVKSPSPESIKNAKHGR